MNTTSPTSRSNAAPASWADPGPGWMTFSVYAKMMIVGWGGYEFLYPLGDTPDRARAHAIDDMRSRVIPRLQAAAQLRAAHERRRDAADRLGRFIRELQAHPIEQTFEVSR